MGLTKDQLVYILSIHGLSSGDCYVYVEADNDQPLLPRDDLVGAFCSAVSACSKNGTKNGLIVFKPVQSERAKRVAEMYRKEPRFKVVEGPYVFP